VWVCCALLHEKTQYVADIAASKTGYRLSKDACHWTVADTDADGTLADANGR